MICSVEKGKGYGSVIMNKFLADKKLPVYLENSNPKENNPFYLKCGFKNIGTFDIYGKTNIKYLKE